MTELGLGGAGPSDLCLTKEKGTAVGGARWLAGWLAAETASKPLACCARRGEVVAPTSPPCYS